MEIGKVIEAGYEEKGINVGGAALGVGLAFFEDGFGFVDFVVLDVSAADGEDEMQRKVIEAGIVFLIQDNHQSLIILLQYLYLVEFQRFHNYFLPVFADIASKMLSSLLYYNAHLGEGNDFFKKNWLHIIICESIIINQMR